MNFKDRQDVYHGSDVIIPRLIAAGNDEIILRSLVVMVTMR